MLSVMMMLFYFTFYSQQVPNILPVSPEASTLGKYGDIPVNLSTGRINYSIPIYTIQENGFQLPINLSYNYSGLMVDEIPGLTGLGWSLNAGGVITRQVRGRPDEDINGYIGTEQIGKNFVIPYIFNPSSFTYERLNTYLEEANNGSIDTQPDKFVLSIGDIHANFYFNENKEIVILPNKKYIIEVINDDLSQGFKVIDEKGIQYFFKEKEHSTRQRFNSISDILATPVNGYTSSWKISKIILTNSKEITFNYVPFTYYQKFSYDIYSKLIEGTNCSSGQFSNKNTYYRLDTKIIHKITFTKGEATFDTSRINTTETNDDYNKYLAALNQITLKDKNQNLINRYDFVYDNLNKTRKLLREIIINNNDENKFSLNYYNPPSDNIYPSQQDFWGFYNSNTTGRFIDYDNLYESRKPDYSKSVSGALKTIKYPTKGVTEIKYEPNTYDPGPTGDDFDDFIASSGECTNLSNTLNVSVGIRNGSTDLDVSDVKTFTVTSDNFYVKINLNVLKNAPYGSVYAGLRRIDSQAPPTGIKGCEDANLNGCEVCYNAEEYFAGGFTQNTLESSFISPKQQRLYPGTYELYATAKGGGFRPCDGSYQEFNGCESLSASASITFSEGIETIPRSREVGGIRVSKVTSCPNSTSNQCFTKKYVYEDDNGVSRGLLFRRRGLFTYKSQTRGASQCTHVNYASSSNTPLGTFFGSHVVYDKVKEYSLDSQGNFNGKKTITFKTTGDSFVPEFPFIQLNNKEWYNGKKLSEVYKDLDDDIVKKTEFSYFLNKSISPGNKTYGLKVGLKIFPISMNSLGYTNILNSDYSVSISTFDSTSEVDLIESKIEKNYNGIGGEAPVTTTTNYYYDNPDHLQQTRVETINSQGEVIKKEIQYAHDVNDTRLINEHRIAEPLEILAYKDDILLSHQKTVYNDQHNPSNLYLPKFIKTTKGAQQLEDRVIYHSYDSKGNPVEVSKKDGTKIYYVWGYQQTQPIAKIEGYTDVQLTNIKSLINTAISKSNIDNDTCSGSQTCKEKDVRTALNAIRNNINMKDSQVTTFTYNPLIGVTSITDPRGQTLYYQYDDFNRLEFIKDADGNLLKEHKYHYKN